MLRYQNSLPLLSSVSDYYATKVEASTAPFGQQIPAINGLLRFANVLGYCGWPFFSQSEVPVYIFLYFEQTALRCICTVAFNDTTTVGITA